MFTKILILVFITIYVTAEIPPYIHICGRKNPNLNECIVDSVYNLRSKICEGIPELEVIPLQTLRVSKLIISKTDNVKLYLKNVQIFNLCDFVVKNVYTDFDKNHFDIQASFKDVFVNSTYDFDIHVLVPIAVTGEFYFTGNMDADISLDLKIVMKKGKKYVFIPKLTMNLVAKEFDLKFENNDSDQMQEIIANFIGNNKEEVFTFVKPVVEKTLSETILSLANNIVKHFTYDELFPDRA